MDRKKIKVLGIIFLLLTVIICTRIFNFTQAEQRKREETAQIFSPYQSYGLIYYEKEDRLYYNGKLVRYFEDIVSSDYFLKWPNQDGTVDVYAQRDESGRLTGVNSFGQQEFSRRTPSMKTTTGELEISNTINGYTDDVEKMVKERIAEAYAPYQQYGLIYDMEKDRLYYNGELVGYFEDRELNHSFGPFEDSIINIYAIRNKDGVLTGLDVDFNNDDNPI